MNNAFKGGLELKFFPTPEFESLKSISSTEHAPIIARNALRLLMMGWSSSWTELISWPVFKAIFIHRDPHLLKELRLAFQQGFECLFEQLKGTTLNKEQNEQVQLYLSNCLALLPYADLTPYESIKIPQCIDNEWVFVEYSVKPIELTAVSGFGSVFLQDHDRVFAYGLEPIHNAKAKSHLIFMGTTYFSGQGFGPQINTDLKGFETVGTSLYESGKERIHQWLLKQKNKAHVCGVSLGGSLSLLLAIDRGDLIEQVNALNPAGLHDHNDQWDALPSKPRVIVQQQGNDPVSFFGVWKKDWEILNVNPPKDKKGPNAFCDHFLNYAGFAETVFTPIDAEEQNQARKARNFWVYSVGRAVVFYGFLLPYTYLIRPVGYFIYNHWLALTLMVLTLASLATIGLTLVGVLPLIILVPAIIALAFSGLMILSRWKKDAVNPPPRDPFTGKELAHMHHPDLSRNPTMDMYNPENTIEFELTYKEVNTYYKMMRCLVKEKRFLPDEASPKKELLPASQNPENEDNFVAMKTTKAKEIHMKSVLTLVEQFGVDNEKELKSALMLDYQYYRLGKCQ